MEPDDERLPPKEWSRGDKLFSAFVVVALLLFLGAVAAILVVSLGGLARHGVLRYAGPR